MQETVLFSGKFYTADKNFIRMLVATVATNSKSATILPQTRSYHGIEHRENLALLRLWRDVPVPDGGHDGDGEQENLGEFVIVTSTEMLVMMVMVKSSTWESL